MTKLSKLNVSNPKVWVVIGVGVAGILILAEVQRRRFKARNSIKEDFGAFIERIELLPFPQPPPPAAPLSLSALTFAIKDKFCHTPLLNKFGHLIKNSFFKKIVLFGLTFCFDNAILDVELVLIIFFSCTYSIDVKESVTGFGSPEWKRTHEVATKTAMVVTALLKNGATCVGKTIMDEFGLG